MPTKGGRAWKWSQHLHWTQGAARREGSVLCIINCLLSLTCEKILPRSTPPACWKRLVFHFHSLSENYSPISLYCQKMLSNSTPSLFGPCKTCLLCYRSTNCLWITNIHTALGAQNSHCSQWTNINITWYKNCTRSVVYFTCLFVYLFLSYFLFFLGCHSHLISCLFWNNSNLKKKRNHLNFNLP